MNKTVVYSLRNKKTGKLIGIRASRNGDDAEFCNEETVTFDEHSDTVFEVKSKSQAIIALLDNPGWYNSSRECPMWESPSKMDDYEIVEVTKTIEETSIDVYMPIRLPKDFKTILHVDICKPKKGDEKSIWYHTYEQANRLNSKRGIIINDIAEDKVNALLGEDIYLSYGQFVRVLGYSQPIQWGKDCVRMIFTSEVKSMSEI